MAADFGKGMLNKKAANDKDYAKQLLFGNVRILDYEPTYELVRR